mgnify:CR=1 FL=1
MILLLAGASHTGKTVLAQKLMEKYHFPYLSIDLLKMGLIRSKYTDLTPMDDEKLVSYLWPIIKEMIKTAIENQQNLIIEGCYIPFDWESHFDEPYRREIKYFCLIMTQNYIDQHYNDIKRFACVIEDRSDDSWCTQENLKKENLQNLQQCQKHNCNYILIEDRYQIDLDL